MHEHSTTSLERSISPGTGRTTLDARDPIFRDRPHEILDELRARDPVHQDRALDRVVLTRATDIAATLGDRTLSSDPFKARPTAYSRRGRPESERGTLSLSFIDDPAHSRLRNLVSWAFTPRAIENMRPYIESLAAQLLDRIDPAHPFDLISAYAAPLPVLVISTMLGIGDADVARFKSLSEDMLIQFLPGRTDEQAQAFTAAKEGIDAHILRELAERRISPRDDLISALVVAETNGESLSEAEILVTCRILLVAGNITTTDLIGNGAIALLQHREQLALLQANPTLWPGTIEEVLRYDSPVTFWNRQALDAREIGGCPVEAGQTITAMLLAANHDPALHTDPHRFDVERHHQKHHSFGGGTHYCLGASLARLEAQIALTALFDRFPRLRSMPDHAPRRREWPGFNGYKAAWIEAS